jgi:hypothetical protein
MEVGLGTIDRVWAIACAGRRSGGSLDCAVAGLSGGGGIERWGDRGGEVCFESGFHIGSNQRQQIASTSPPATFNRPPAFELLGGSLPTYHF